MTPRERVARAILASRCARFLDGECDGLEGCDACLQVATDEVLEAIADHPAAAELRGKR